MPGLGGGATATLSAVVAPLAPGGEWVVAGTETAGGGSTAATIWTSRSGRRWTAHALAGTDGRALAAVSDGTRLVVVGSVGTGSSQRAAVWLSPGPGRLPVPVPSQASLSAPVSPSSPGGATMDLVAAGTVGLVAAGSVGGLTAVWYSSAGTTWTQEPAAERLVNRRGGSLTSLLVYPAGILAAGTVADGSQTGSQLWASTDGIHWASAGGGAFSPPGDHVVTGLTWNGRELVAVGAVRATATWLPAAWVSPGGEAWSQTIEDFPQSFPAAGGGSALRAVASDQTAAVGTGSFVAVGGTTAAPAAWTSANGEEWAPLALPGAAATADLVGTAGGTTVVADAVPGQPWVLVRGRSRSSSTWLAPARATAQPVGFARFGGELYLAVDVAGPAPGAAEAVVARSAGGTAWQVVATLRGARVNDLAVVGASLVAAGVAGPSSAGRVWTSTDGVTWSASAAGVPAVAVTAAGGSLVVAGTASVAGRPAAATPAGTLSAVTTVGGSWPVGACSAGTGAVVVGATTRSGPPPTLHGHSTSAVPVDGSGPGPAGQQDDGTQAAAWSSAGGVTWSAGTVSPQPGVGATESMDGCFPLPGGSGASGAGASDGSGAGASGAGASGGSGAGGAVSGGAGSTSTAPVPLVAYGQTTGRGGSHVPALWESTDGAGTWTRLSPAGITGAGVAPFCDVAASGDRWLAAGGSQPAPLALPVDPRWSVEDPIGPPAVPSYATGPDGEAGVWLSSDAGASWARLATTGAAWGGGQVTTDAVAWLAARPVVAGEVDGRLAIWVGTPAPAPPASG